MRITGGDDVEDGSDDEKEESEEGENSHSPMYDVLDEGEEVAEGAGRLTLSSARNESFGKGESGEKEEEESEVFHRESIAQRGRKKTGGVPFFLVSWS